MFLESSLLHSLSETKEGEEFKDMRFKERGRQRKRGRDVKRDRERERASEHEKERARESKGMSQRNVMQPFR